MSPHVATARFPGEGHPRRRAILAALCAALLVMSVSVMAVTIALPSIALDLRATTAQLQWITEAAVLALASLLIAMGALTDRAGGRRVLMAGLGVFALASILAVLSRTPEQLIAARVVQGAGNAMITPATLAILRTVFPRSELPKALAAWGVVASLGVVLGPLSGGLLVEHFGWRSLFVANVVVLAGAWVAIVRVVPAAPGPPAAPGSPAAPGPPGVPAGGRVEGRFDVLGVLLVSGGFVAMVHAVIEGPYRGWASPVTLGEAGVAALLLAGFAVRQWRVAQTEATARGAAEDRRRDADEGGRRGVVPLLDLRMVARRSFWPAALAAGTGFFALMGVLFLLTQYLQDVRGHSPSEAALLLLPVAAAQLGMAPLVVRAIARYGTRRTAAAGLAVLAAGAASMAGGIRTGELVLLIGGLAVLAAGNAVAVNAAGTAMMASAPAARSGSAGGVNETAFKLGGSLGVAVLGGLAGGRLATLLDPGTAVPRSISGVLDAARNLGGPEGDRLAAVATTAFTDAFGTAALVTACLAAGSAVLTALLLHEPDDSERTD
ncbi:MFS transporter [Nonomuraea sp. NPDC050404]|uniref:MFS transporter n=1 Tax=Nonomuraea sp. NPDC050404 TaxID=3155783 RepID=UPI0033F8A619